MADEAGLRDGMSKLYAYGCVIVEGVPTDMDSTRKACERIGHLRETIYGMMWDTAPKSEGQVNDTAYTNMELKPHMDLTYLRDGKGLQVFNCAADSKEGGATWLVDSFAVMEELRTTDPEAFRFFCDTPLQMYCIEDEVHVEAFQPIIRLGLERELVSVGLNDNDRGSLDHLTDLQIDQFYRHWHKVLRMTRAPTHSVERKLKVGDMLIVDNSRIMHARRAFVGYRNLVGCYLNSDQYESRLRLLGIIA
eukprot:NODE_15859_length_1025_cov_10.446548.p1 GENE.NODE_15859_length_1025_cov_10.446548~~NODE_15859_length_1025_cov_10.446548.p1  ORF type:complete len:271 (-),score=102.54 NODE_15859_length_1025_cov_10.446548:212-958(-)